MFFIVCSYIQHMHLGVVSMELLCTSDDGMAVTVHIRWCCDFVLKVRYNFLRGCAIFIFWVISAITFHMPCSGQLCNLHNQSLWLFTIFNDIS